MQQGFSVLAANIELTKIVLCMETIGMTTEGISKVK